MITAPQALRLITASALLAVTCALPLTALAQDGRLPTAALQKAALKCQKTLAQVSAKVLAGKLKALDGCAGAALACVQTKAEKADCLGKAGETCVKKLGGAGAAASAARTKILATKSCSQDLRLPDLLAADGLGLGALALPCRTDFDLDVCSGVDAIADCLVRTHDRAAGELYGAAAPRAGELLDLLGVVLPTVAGLTVTPGCDTCSVAPTNRKAVEQCGKTITKAMQALIAGLEKQLGTCAQKALACVQSATPTAQCFAKASAGCDKGGGAITAAVAKFTAAVAKKCGAVAFDQLGTPAGLNLEALVTPCLDAGAPAPTGVAPLTACLDQRARCTVAALVRSAIARAPELGDDDRLGGLADELAAACPVVGASTLQRAGGERVGFSSILKVMKSIRRPGSGLFGVRRNTSLPTSSFGAVRGVTIKSGVNRVSWGGLTKMRFNYRLGGSALRTGGARAEEPPKLIVGVAQGGVPLEDHFEIELDPLAAGAEGEDEIEIAYADTIDDCAFTLTLATAADGAVSGYTDVVQVVDTAVPTPTPTPGPSATAVATVTATVTPAATVTSTATSGATGTPTPTTTRTPTPSSTATTTTTPTLSATRTATFTPSPGPTHTPGPGSVAIAMNVFPNPARAGELVTYEILVVNDGGSPQAVTVTDVLPADIPGLTLVDGAVCAGGSCQATETATWNLGTLAAGQTKTRRIAGLVSATAVDGLVIPNTAVAHPTSGDVAATTNLTIDGAALLHVAIVGDRDPVSSGATLGYTVSYANRGRVDALGATLRLTLPAGATFVGADEGGILAGDVVTWSLGDLPPGQGGERHVDVQVAATADTILTAVVDVDDTLGQHATATALAAVSAATPLTITHTAYLDPARPGEEIIEELTVANSGASSQTVTLSTVIPQELVATSVEGGVCAGGSCQSLESVSWDLGTLAPGQSKTRRLIGTLGATIANGELMYGGTALAASGSAEARAARALRVASGERMQVAIVEDHDPAAPADLLRYTLTYANRGTIDATGVALRQVLPRDAIFLRADGGGVHADGVVTWNLGTVAPGAGGERTVDVVVASAVGNVLLTAASTRDELGERAGATAATSVTTPPTLTIAKTIFPDPPLPNEAVVMTIAVGNTGGTAQTVTLTDHLPQELASVIDAEGGSCGGGSCQPQEDVSWSLGSLGPGQVVTRQVIGKVGASLPPGELMFTGAARASNGTAEVRAARAVRVNGGEPLQLALAADRDPVTTGGRMRYVVTFANRGSLDASGVTLRLTLPLTVGFVAADGNGQLVDDVVTWDLGTLTPGASGTRTVDVMLSDLPAGSILRGAASAVDAFGRYAIATTHTPVVTTSPLAVTKVVTSALPAVGGPLSYDVTVRNNSDSPLTVTLVDPGPDEFASFSNADGASCAGGSCQPPETLTWLLGTLQPSQQVTKHVVGTLDGAAALHAGEIVRNTATARSGTIEARATIDVAVQPAP